MSETADDVITSALLDIGVQASESPLEEDEIRDAIKYMNRMMNKFAAEGINLGYTNVSTLADVITIPDGAIDGLISNLAIRLHPQFALETTPVSIVLAQEAKDGKDVMRVLAIPSIGPTAFPDTLPIGSGNEDGFAGCDNHFFTSDLDNIETEQGGFIAVEDSTHES